MCEKGGELLDFGHYEQRRVAWVELQHLKQMTFVTRFAKTDHFPKTELLVPLECAILGQSNGGIGAAISGSIAK